MTDYARVPRELLIRIRNGIENTGEPTPDEKRRMIREINECLGAQRIPPLEGSQQEDFTEDWG